MQSLENFLKNVKTLAIVCNQWGDTGKGKFVDFFAEWADIIARGTGGANAGHTIKIGDKEYIFHLIPSGILYDKEGKINIIGNGTVLDLATLANEINILDERKITYNNLLVSKDANLVMPWHIEKDKEKNVLDKKDKQRIGSTGRGIGPVYTDKIARRGIELGSLFDKDLFVRKARSQIEKGGYDVKNLDDIVESQLELFRKVKPFVKDTIKIINDKIKENKKILLEGAQGLLLSIEYGTTPYVTSSDCSVNGLAAGVGIYAPLIDLTLGIVKAPYMTRVGNGPFPTEFGGKESEEYCAAGLEHNKEFEKSKYNASEIINSQNEFLQGIAVRMLGDEYGATTGRPRRTGWLDLVALKYACQINGPNIIISKPDVLNDVDEIKLCYDYYNGAVHGLSFEKESAILQNYRPIYKTLPGWKQPIDHIKDYDGLPANMENIFSFIEKSTGTSIRAVSVGKDREQTILR